MSEDSVVLKNQLYVPPKIFKRKLKDLLLKIWGEIPSVLHSYVINYLHSSYEDEFPTISEAVCYSFSFHPKYTFLDTETTVKIVNENIIIGRVSLWGHCSGVDIPGCICVRSPSKLYLKIKSNRMFHFDVVYASIKDFGLHNRF